MADESPPSPEREYAEALSHPQREAEDVVSGKQYGSSPDEILEQIAPDALERERGSPENGGEDAAEGDGLTAEDVAEFFLSPLAEELAPDELAQLEAERARLEAEQAVEDLRSGRVINQIADMEEARKNAVEDLIRRKPGMTSGQAFAEIGAFYSEIRDRYPGIGDDPQLATQTMERIYEVLGGEDRFSDPWEQLANERPSRDIITGDTPGSLPPPSSQTDDDDIIGTG